MSVPTPKPPRATATGPVARMSLAFAVQRGWFVARTSSGEAMLAAVGGIVVMLAARLLFGITTPTELVGDHLTTLIPLSLFSTLLSVFGQNAKHLYFGGLLIAQGLGSAVLLTLYWGGRVVLTEVLRGTSGSALPGSTQAEVPSQEPAVGHTEQAPNAVSVSGLSPASDLRPTPHVGDVIGFSIWLLAISAFVLMPLAVGTLALCGSEVVPALGTGGIFVWLCARASKTAQQVESAPASWLSRRRVLRQAAFGLGLLAGTAVVWELVQRGAASLGLIGSSTTAPQLHLGNVPEVLDPPPTPVYPAWTPVAGQTPELTSTAHFYYVSKNLVGDPNLDATQWHLEIKGLVDHPTTLTLAALRSLPRMQRYQTLECISNEVGGDLMSTTLWTGTSLAHIASAAGIQPAAAQMIFRCADGYSDRHHLSQVLDPRAWIVYEMNGDALPQAHGYPARLLIPGRYGMKNGKWITSLEFAAGDYQGYWEQQGWTSEAVVKLTSRIDVPADGEFLPVRPVMLAGVAYSGDQGIAQVEVSTDGGQNWTAAALKRPLSELTWVLWELEWAPHRGTYVLVVRAIDLAGRVQSPQPAMPLPNGASGYHAISVTVG